MKIIKGVRQLVSKNASERIGKYTNEGMENVIIKEVIIYV